MNVIRTADFDRSFANLPQDAKRLCDVQVNRFYEDWRDPRLHVKKLRGLDDVFSMRVTRRWRALFYFQDTDSAIFFDIDHRKDAYR